MILPDYIVPAALIVPHLQADIIHVLEHIARSASNEVGIILVTQNMDAAANFVNDCTYPDHFSIITAPLNSPWIRDLSPFICRRKKTLYYIQPLPHMPGREKDSVLYTTITRQKLENLPLNMPQGNLVAGPAGIALSTDRFFTDNNFNQDVDLKPFKKQLGIRDWYFFPPLDKDLIAHADCYTRFLSPTELAIGIADGHLEHTSYMMALVEALKKEIKNLQIYQLPITAHKQTIASPLNWIQLDKVLLVPEYPGTTKVQKHQILETLTSAGYTINFIPSPTAELGGALHCLTASVYV